MLLRLPPRRDKLNATLLAAVVFAIGMGLLALCGCEYRPLPVTPEGGGGSTSRSLAVIVIEESNATPEYMIVRGKYNRDRALHEYIRSHEHVWRMADVGVKVRTGEVPADLAPFIEHAKKRELPRYYLADRDTGKTVSTDRLPDEPAALLALIQKYD